MLQKPSKKSSYSSKNSEKKFAIVTSLYHEALTKSMEQACVDYLIKAGVKKENIAQFYAPGSWEIPLIVQTVAKSKKYDCIATFGVIVKGDTFHFEMIANQCSQALMQISLAENIPVVFEVLAVYTLAQAKKRAMGVHNKGIEAAQTLLMVTQTISQIKK